MDFTTMSNADITAALSNANERAAALFALDAPTVAQADEATEVMASIREIKTEQADRAKQVKAAADKFAAAKAEFAVNEGVETGPEDGEEGSEEGTEEPGEDEGTEETGEDGEGDGEGEVDAATEDKSADAPPKPFEKKKKEDEEETMSAAASQTFKPTASAAKKVGAKTKRPARATTSPVTITAAADVPNFATGSPMADMNAVARGLIGRTKGFAPFNLRSAEAVRSQGSDERLNKFGLASLGLSFTDAMTASSVGDDYSAVQESIKTHVAALTASVDKNDPDTLSAAGWCAPSEVVWTYLANYQVGNLLTLPEVNAPRGGLMTTTGPALAEQYNPNGTDFGFVQTEAQAEARQVKTCETIICPEFEDHRLDAIGYCWKIPILTQKAYPELIADALRLSSVLYAHKMNSRHIGDILALSDAVTISGLGASFTDTLEALTVIAVKERRKWLLGDNAVMEVKMPVWAREVFRAEMSRRPFRSGGPVTDAEINAEFTSRRLAPEYVEDWEELAGANPVFPATFPVMVYPAGTFVKAVEDVINLSAVYDAASLSVNEYTGVFFEQGVMTFKAGYGSTKFTVPICTAGLVGAPILDCNTSTGNFAGGETAPVV